MAIVINGSGTVTGISVGGLPDDIVDAGTLADNAVGLAQMAGGTDGNIITYDTSGNPAVVATGSDGQVLTSAGADAVPAFEAAPGGGKLLQAVAFVEDSSEQTLATATYTDTGLSVSITPTLDTSKILCMWNMHYQNTGNPTGLGCQLVRDVTNVWTSGSNYDIQARTAGNRRRGSWMYLDSPNTTSATTYKIQVSSQNGSTIYLNDDSNKTQLLLMEIGV